jgi:signal peptidase I
MNISLRYSDLGVKSRRVLGYISFCLLFGGLGIIFRPVLYLFIVLNYTVAIGHMLEDISPYYVRFSSGNSMMPAMPLGLKANVSTDRYDSIEIGDVISYRVEEQDYDIHHRVVAIEHDEYILRGDWNDGTDPYRISKDQVVCKSVQHDLQPLYIPLSPFALIGTIMKCYKKLAGKHRSMLNQHIIESGS